MRNLLDMERDFFSGSNRVNFNRINGLLTTLSDSKKAKFDITVKLSKEVYKSFNWFNSDSGKEEMRIAGISMNAEQFGNKIFGWKKSYFYKMVKLGTVAEEQRGLITRFKTECTRLESQGENVSRSLENMLKYANDSARSTSESGEDSAEVRTQNPLKWEFKTKMGGVGSIKAYGTEGVATEIRDNGEFTEGLKNFLQTINRVYPSILREAIDREEIRRRERAQRVVDSATERIMENSIDSA
ncbi:MAG: hypothetical protein GOVbin1678_41 [Prokaryotic dsDNA virus sp.]|nr:MAG: hypothetical protein GOVbin1678_41 [Prokaryotic dsDNA virus sp.]|tara:strand:+ start:20681 stop:21406 length:726 start_codon:yes stop_codon:yes gene_type:complete